MNVLAVGEELRTAVERSRIVDCDIHPGIKSPDDIRSRLPERWKSHFDVYGSHLRQPCLGTQIYLRMSPGTAREDAWPPSGGIPGSDLEFMRRQHLDANNVQYGILHPLLLGGYDQLNLEYGAALCSATNLWQAEHWLANEPRLRGSIVVPQDHPEAALKEIERWVDDRRFVQVSLAPTASEPLGRRRYWPIYEMVQRSGLPLGLHIGGVNGFPPSAGGWVSYYFEHHFSSVPALASLVVSLVLEGVFEQFPRLRVILTEAGFAWVPPLCWRLDQHWERMRTEVPHLKHPPSHYIKNHFWFTTQPIEEPNRPGDLRRLIDWVGWDRLLFSTDYPHWDFDDPAYAFRTKLSKEEEKMVFRTNAINIYGLES